MDGRSKGKGGRAAAAKMTPEQRKERAQKAIQARWDENIPKAVKAGELKIGEIIIPCAVLNDTTRLITQRGMLGALGRKTTGGPKKDPERKMPTFLEANNLKPFISNQLEEMTKPIKFRLPKDGKYSGTIANGYNAQILADLCNVFLDAKESGVLTPQQMHIAERCKILQRGFSVTGLIGLIDEATGYQQFRDKDALQHVLESFLRKELSIWAKRFPDEFYKQIYRLKGWDWKGMETNRFPLVGKITTDVIYERLGTPLIEEMRSRCPKDEKGVRKSRFHQCLSDEIGLPKLAEHFSAVIALQKACNNWDQFYELIDKILPKKNTLRQLDIFDQIT